MTIALVSGQIVNAQNLAGASVDLVLPSAPMAGNLVCVSLVASLSTTSFTITDGNSNAYTITPQGITPDGFNAAVKIANFYLRNAPANASATIHCTANAGTAILCSAAEFSGVDPSANLIDKEGVGNSTVTQTNVDTPSLTPAQAGSLFWSGVDSLGGHLSSVDSPWTTVVSILSASYAGAYYIQGTPGASQNFLATQSVADAWLSQVTIFKPAPASMADMMGQIWT